MTPAEILRAALAKLDGGRAWTKGLFAVDSAGERCPTNDPDVRCFCAGGALFG